MAKTPSQPRTRSSPRKTAAKARAADRRVLFAAKLKSLIGPDNSHIQPSRPGRWVGQCQVRRGCDSDDQVAMAGVAQHRDGKLSVAEQMLIHKVYKGNRRAIRLAFKKQTKAKKWINFREECRKAKKGHSLVDNRLAYHIPFKTIYQAKRFVKTAPAGMLQGVYDFAQTVPTKPPRGAWPHEFDSSSESEGSSTESDDNSDVSDVSDFEWYSDEEEEEDSKPAAKGNKAPPSAKTAKSKKARVHITSPPRTDRVSAASAAGQVWVPAGGTAGFDPAASMVSPPPKDPVSDLAELDLLLSVQHAQVHKNQCDLEKLELARAQWTEGDRRAYMLAKAGQNSAMAQLDLLKKQKALALARSKTGGGV